MSIVSTKTAVLGVHRTKQTNKTSKRKQKLGVHRTKYAKFRFWGCVKWGTEVPLRRGALSVCPCGDPWGIPLQVEIRHSWAPVRPPRGQTLRSPRPKATSVLTRPIANARSAAGRRNAHAIRVRAAARMRTQRYTAGHHLAHHQHQTAATPRPTLRPTATHDSHLIAFIYNCIHF